VIGGSLGRPARQGTAPLRAGAIAAWLVKRNEVPPSLNQEPGLALVRKGSNADIRLGLTPM